VTVIDFERAFIEEIRADPRDEVPRLVYADYLEESGDPRGEFIRIQCELTHLQPADPARVGLEARESELLDAHAEAWLAPLRQLGAEGLSVRCFQRGLIERVRIDARTFLSNAGELCDIAPALYCVELKNVTEAVTELGGAALPEQITSLDLSANRLQSPAIAGWASAPWTSQLTEFNLEFNRLADEGLAHLASLRLPNLQKLSLGVNGVGPAGVASLTNGPLAQLTALSLRVNPIGDAGAKRLASWPDLANLRELDLASAELQTPGAKALAESPHLNALAHLNLCGNHIKRPGLLALAKADGWELTRLDVRSNADGPPAELTFRYGDTVLW